MPERVFYEVIVPLLLQRLSSLICISTVQGDDNFFTKLIRLQTKDNPPRPVFRVLSTDIVCTEPECQMEPERCWHKIHEIPRWHDAKRHKRVRLLMESNPTIRDREVMGLIANQAESLFKRALLERQLERAPTFFPTTVTLAASHVYIMVDPNANGTSCYAVVSMFQNPMSGRFVICGLENHDTRKAPDEYKTILIRHLLGLRSRWYLQRARFVVAVESNLANEADRTKSHVQMHNRHIARNPDEQITNTSFLREDFQHQEWRVGVRMTHNSKITMANHLIDILSMPVAQFEIFNEPVAFETKRGDISEARFHANYAALITQLSTYQRIYRETSGRTGAPMRVDYTGKISGGADDLAIAFQWIFIVQRMFHNAAVLRYAAPDPVVE